MEIAEAITKLSEWLKKASSENECGMGQPDDIHFMAFAIYFAMNGGDLDGLLAMRGISLWMAKTSKGTHVLRHKVATKDDPDGWPSEDEYQAFANGFVNEKGEKIDGILSSKKEVVMKGLALADETALAISHLMGAWGAIANRSSNWYKKNQ